MATEIQARTTVRAPLTVARRVLNEQLAEVLGAEEQRGRPGRRCRTSLVVDMGGGTSLHQVVELCAGRARVRDDGVVEMPLSWVVPARNRLPSFEGTLELRATEGRRTMLSLLGHYDVPLGLLGRLGDAAAGRRVAQPTLDRFLRDLGNRLDHLADRRRPRGQLRADPVGVVDLRDAHASRLASENAENAGEAVEKDPGSELFLG